VLSLPKDIVPKLASGSTPRDEDGASAIHSAEDLAAFVTVPVVVKVHPAVMSVMLRANLLLNLLGGSRAKNVDPLKIPLVVDVPV